MMIIFMRSRILAGLASLLLVLAAALPALAEGQRSLAVFVVKSPTLHENEQVSLNNIIAKGFADTGKYRIVDPETLDRMLEDKVMEALLLGNEDRLDEIQAKYRVDVLVDVSARVESSGGLGTYSLASSTVTIACRSNESGELFDQRTSEPQNGFYGMPEWLGATAEAARKVAILAAVADIFQEIEAGLVMMPLPEKASVQLLELGSEAPAAVFMEQKKMSSDEAARLADIASNSIGKKSKITCKVLDKGMRIGAVGILKTDIDLQRRRRLDTAEFQVFDFRKGRRVTSFQLARDVPGVRRPKSREIVDIAFAPSGRFLVGVSRHPAIWVYDILSGEMLALQKISRKPASVELSSDGRFVRVNSGRNSRYYEIVPQGGG